MRFPVLNLFGTRYEDRNKGGQDKALGPSGYRVGLRSQSSSQALAGEAWWELRSRPVLEKEGERRGRVSSWAFCGDGRWGTASCQGSPGESVFLITLVLSF